MMPRHWMLMGQLALCLLCLPSPVLANAAQTLFPGESAMEVDPLLEGIRIEHEDLNIDLRRLADSGWGVIEARYHLRNVGNRRRLTLRFVLGSALLQAQNSNEYTFAPRSFEAWIDGWGIQGLSYDSLLAPVEWLPPSTTPAIDGDGPHEYESEIAYGARANAAGETVYPVHVLSFSVEIDSGQHELRVRYRTRPALATDHSPAQLWQLGYVLAPARRWGGFGTLSAKVLLPPAWLASVFPSMTRRGDTLHAVWQGLPSDALAITVRHPLPRWVQYLPEIFGVVLGVLALALGHFAVRRATSSSAVVKKRAALRTTFLPVVTSGIVALAMHFGWSIGEDIWDNAAANQKPDLYLHGCLWYVVAIPALSLAALLYLVRVARRRVHELSKEDSLEPPSV